MDKTIHTNIIMNHIINQKIHDIIIEQIERSHVNHSCCCEQLKKDMHTFCFTDKMRNVNDHICYQCSDCGWGYSIDIDGVFFEYEQPFSVVEFKWFSWLDMLLKLPNLLEHTIDAIELKGELFNTHLETMH